MLLVPKKQSNLNEPTSRKKDPKSSEPSLRASQTKDINSDLWNSRRRESQLDSYQVKGTVELDPSDLK